MRTLLRLLALLCLGLLLFAFPAVAQEEAIAVTAGGAHACALTSSGGIKCWGANSRGQLGDGTTNNSSVPVPVVGFREKVIAVSAGNNHTCAVLNSGAVKCWGDNSFNQITNEDSVKILVPKYVDLQGSSAAKLAVGANYNCVLTNSRSVICWGINSSGQLGDGTREANIRPVRVRGLSADIVSISLGNSHSCVLLSDGDVECWGSNSYNKINDTQEEYILNPVSIGLKGVKEIVAARDHSCVLLGPSAIDCWGLNSQGQLGDGTNIQRQGHVRVNNLREGIADIYARSGYTCVITESKTVKCWGISSLYTLSHTPVLIQGMNDIVDISLGFNLACSLSRAGVIKCLRWGELTEIDGFEHGIVAAPEVALSSAVLVQGSALTVSGRGFAPGGAVSVVVVGPSGFEPLVTSVTASAAGEIAYTFATSAATPAGYYALSARDMATRQTSPGQTFRVDEAPPADEGIVLLSPAPSGAGKNTDAEGAEALLTALGGDQCTNGAAACTVTWQDRARNFDVYPKTGPGGINRLYRYAIEVRLSGATAWTSVSCGQASGACLADHVAFGQGTAFQVSRKVTLPPGSGHLLRVRDTAVPTRTAESALFAVGDESAQELDVDFVWDNSYPAASAPVVGVSADGTARFFLKAFDRNPLNARTIRTVQVRLTDVDGSSDGTTTRTLGKVMFENVAANVAPGTMSTSANAASASTATGTAPTRLDGLQQQFYFWYVAPDDFARTEALDGSKRRRHVIATFTATLSDGTTSTIVRPIEIVRPPLMLVHGLGADPSTWASFRLRDNLLATRDPRWIEPPRAIALSGTASFCTNVATLLNFPATPPTQGNSFASLIYAQRASGYATNQVDYVGHSMGGVLLRTARAQVSAGGSVPTCGTTGPKWSVYRNYGLGFVHKAVTMNTPHHGSEFSNFLREIAPTATNNLEFRISLGVLGGFYGCSGHQAGDKFCITGTRDLTTAGRQLATDAIGAFYQTTTGLRVHTVAGDVFAGLGDANDFSTAPDLSERFTSAMRIGTLPNLTWVIRTHFKSPALRIVAAANAAKESVCILGAEHSNCSRENATLMDAIGERYGLLAGEAYGLPTFGRDGDLVVGLRSQLSGVSSSQGDGCSVSTGHSIFVGRTHSGAQSSKGITVDPVVGGCVDRLLNVSRVSSAFATSLPAPPPPIRSSTERSDEAPYAAQAEQRTSSPAIQLTSPLWGERIAGGTMLSVRVSVPDTVGLRYLRLRVGSATLVDSTQRTAYAFSVPTSSLTDSTMVMVVAEYLKADGYASAIDTAQVFVEPASAPVRLRIQETFVNELPGRVVQPRYEAEFGTFIGGVGGPGSGITATVSNPAVLQFDAATGTFRTVAAGESYAVVRYRGVEDTLFVNVEPIEQDTPVGIEQEGAARITEAAITNVYPNPSRGAVHVRYALPAIGAVRVEVYDVLGRRVAVLHEGDQAAGEHTATWEAGAASSGLYLLRVRTEGRVLSRTVTLVR